MRCALLLAAAHAAPKTVILNNGVEMPLLSLGTAGFDDAASEEAVKLAYNAGIRAIDTAFNYYNQKGVGRGLKAVNRSEVFLITKTTPCYHPQAPPKYNISNPIECGLQTEKDILSNLEQLQEDYIDLLLLHGPNHFGAGSCTKETCALDAAQWAVYEAMLKKGKVRAIGVSNYCSSCLSCLMGDGRVTPAVNQVEFHPGMSGDPEGIMSFCSKYSVVPMAYSPMGGGAVFSDPFVGGIAKAHNKTAAQVALNWILAKEFAVATKTNSPQHLQEDLDVFDWALSSDETGALDAYRNGTDKPSWGCSDVALV